jgi:hypothetical protein
MLQAIQDFAASMGLSYEELRSRPGLVDTLLTYHIIPRKLTGMFAADVSAHECVP